MIQKIPFSLFAFLAFIITLVHAQDQPGFISIDCGSPESSYTDTYTKISYVSDAAFVDAGVTKAVTNASSLRTYYKNLQYLRIFPEGSRNCFKLQQGDPNGFKKNGVYLIRARFFGEVNSTDSPTFDLYLGDKFWDSVTVTSGDFVTDKEIIHVISSNYLHICLLDTGNGTPFISAIELRLLDNSIYKSPSGSLKLFRRRNVAANTNDTIRYPDDIYDRFWFSYNYSNGRKISNSITISADNNNIYKIPSTVLTTAATPWDENEPMVLTFEGKDWNSTSKFYLYLHFAELQVVETNNSRQFSVYTNGDLWSGDIVVNYLKANTVYSAYGLSGSKLEILINKTQRSTLPPILNAFEIYTEIDLLPSETKQADVEAITNIKFNYGVKRNWQGDPCFPQSYMWIGLNCISNGDDPTRIISLNLSSSGLSGEISPHFASLEMINSLDLSNNSLNGSVPGFFSQLKSLKVLNLSGNNFTGSLPDELVKRSKDGLLLLSVDAQRNETQPENKNTNVAMVVVVAVVVAAVVTVLVMVVAFAIVLHLKKIKLAPKSSTVTNNNRRGGSFLSKHRKNGSFQVKHRYTYSEIIEITNNFDSTIGEGGFGKVYLGYLDGNQVAVKMLSERSHQGYQHFEAEVKLLLRVHHTNLTSLVGYCDERSTIGLIYEYMEKGDLRKHLSNRSAHILSWEERLRIAAGSAQGLDYLHRGCKPSIIHRDIKSTNILLNVKFQAKLADFGLSREFLIETEGGPSHIFTSVIGTPGFLDPVYNQTHKLTRETDVYSFGVVLLEIITGRGAVVEICNDDNEISMMHISKWVQCFIKNGDIKNIIDPKLSENFDMNSAWKVVEVAMSCLSLTSNLRLPMNNVVTELEECLAMEITRSENRMAGLCEVSTERLTAITHSGSSPLVR